MPEPKSKRENTAFPHAQRSSAWAGAALAIATTLPGAFTASVLAQVPPTQSDSGIAREHRRQEERERVLRDQQERMPDVRLSMPGTTGEFGRLPDGEADCIGIKNITLTGQGADRFQWAIAHADQLGDGMPDPATGRCLGTRGVNLAMGRIQNAMIARGYVAARVLAGSQSRLAEGTLELTLFPGRVRRIRFAPGTHDRATAWNAVPVRSGDLLNLRDIEQALENFKRVPSAEADIQVIPAEGPDAEPGESDLIVRWSQGLPVRLSFAADDSGTSATGKYQGSATMSYDHWWTLNDLLYVSLGHDLGGGDPGASGTRGTRSYTVHYSVPNGYWLLGFTASHNRHHQSVPGASQTYIYRGESHNSEVRLSRLIHRDAKRKTTVILKGWARASRSYIDDTEVAVQRRRMAGVDVGVAHREFMGAATLDAGLNHRRGTGAWNALPAPEEAFGEGTSRPRIITADAQLNAPFKLGGQRLRYTGSWRAQWNRTPLVPQDRFAIGSRYTVRGFDGEHQLLAERGWLVRNDLGWALGASGLELYAGIDHGQVRGPGSNTLVGKQLSGAVLGLRGGFKQFFYELFAGAPIDKPAGLRTPGSVAGFSVHVSF